ncbi:MAG: transposase [Candidatus Vogelbacteria bacterium]|nr:transposase [Candidatus Vogelbacteria bacterium]
MGIRDIDFVEGECYHIFNRGTDKRTITEDKFDSDRFVLSLQKFNVIDPIGSIYESSFHKHEDNEAEHQNRLVDMIAFCLNPNHFHLLVTQLTEAGVSKFLHRVQTGYSKYYNTKHKRKGTLFQGKFGASLITLNDNLLHVSAYVNLNNKVHQLGSKASKLVRSSYSYFIEPAKKPNWICNDVVMEQFKNSGEYKLFAEDSLELMLQSKTEQRERKIFDEFA